MNTLKETKEKIVRDQQNWCIYLMDFVDDFRYYKDTEMIAEPFELSDEKTDALLASTAESLCDELKIELSEWLEEVPACEKPYFVGEIENLKAISIVESPLRFKIRNIFVLENFLGRV
ncbi:hypothetical protein BH18ACI1_BH18ACI1_18720 [soil metagenome]|jgi:hypothetical protein|nr:hypothetical protein [Acidobacteriota bacterium]